MNKKSNTGIAVLITFLIMIIIFGVVLLLLNKDAILKSNKEQKDNKEEIIEENKNDKLDTINEELRTTISFATKKNDQIAEIIAIQEDGTEIKIMDVSDLLVKNNWKGEIKYYYENGKLYYAISSCDDGNGKCYEKDHKHEIGYIDLNKGNGQYKYENLIRVDDNIERFSTSYGDSIIKIGDDIYFSDKKIYKYNLNTKEITDTKISDEKRLIWLFKYKDSLLYNLNTDIYILDTKTNESKLLIKDSNMSFVYKDYLIYTKYTTDNDTTILGSYYSYNINTLKTEKISDRIGVATMNEEYIVPYDDFYININRDGLLYNSKKGNILTCETIKYDSIDFECDKYSISKIVKSGKDNIIVQYRDKDEINGTLKPISIEYNITDEKVIKQKDNYSYKNVIYID